MFFFVHKSSELTMRLTVIPLTDQGGQCNDFLIKKNKEWNKINKTDNKIIDRSFRLTEKSTL